ncbi:MAG: cbb3-type cytochrome oxidase assembly protein CcoS [Sulfuriferula sp.]
MTTATLVFLLAMTALFIFFMVLGIFWAIKSGQFDDMEGPAQRILMDDDDPMLPTHSSARKDDGTKLP